ncbi:ABC transporter ATP-binding protein [Austwickia chelonae]|uniref:ABC transporter ATP-binding protein n=1 Tax=Austwickia chelonae TaxID=100225 RepID=UPI000E277136|nr:ATP-binding cassette domain-containing protein [Austwickia chelonae]
MLHQLSLKKATKSFGNKQLWAGLDLQVSGGESLALSGPSGSGKTTLLNCIGALDELTAGDIYLDDVHVNALRERQTRSYRRDHIGYLFQDYALIDDADVYANLEVAVGVWGTSRRIPRSKRREAFDAALDQVGLTGRGHDPVHILSGGEQQRVALARLMIKKPSIVLADEPTAALDLVNEDMVLDALRKLADEGAIIVIATHNERVYQWCDQAIQLSEADHEAHCRLT